LYRNGAACRVSSFTLVGFIDLLDAGGFLQESVMLLPDFLLKLSLICPGENSAVNELQREFACVHDNASAGICCQ
jgi:hypothetical protein